ncbi:hypothetical protein LguiA_010548 [Lonicera macranthoides]
MEQYYSGEELVIKARKPYTITKQRERWTEEEHNRFLEALKLYGRAWQRIEEHIGTKTAVQIRSHAQKFFTKLEKEAVVKGVPTGQSLEIEIPPPRPKRKPSNPYPRKTSVGAPTLQVAGKDGKSMASVSSVQATSHTLDLEKEPPPEIPSGNEKLEKPMKKPDEENCSEVFSPFQEAPFASLSSANKNSIPPVAPRNSCAFKEFVPILKEVTNQDETNESYLTVEPNQRLDKLDSKNRFCDKGTFKTSNLGSSNPSNEKLVQTQELDEQTLPRNIGASLTNDMQASQNYPRHVPVHVVDGNQGTSKQNVSQEMLYQLGQVHGQPPLFANLPATSVTTEDHSMSRSSVHQSLPTFLPLFNSMSSNQDDYRSFLHMSSTFPSLIVSALLQNPAAHAAASIAAASVYPCANAEASAGDFQSSLTNSAPSMTALAAATVAAATAWWAAHGLLPSCNLFDAAFTGNIVSAATAAPGDDSQAAASDRRGEVAPDPDPALENQELDPEGSEAALPEQNSSDSEESEDRKLNTGIAAAADPVQSAAATELHDSNKMRSRKQLDRSSCGSNTASSSEVETDALGKHEKGKEECKEPDVSNTTSSDSNRRPRISSNFINDSWKEVSQGGRLAFQALFSRERLPQSFSPPNNEGQQKSEMEKDDKQCTGEDDRLQLDLNSKIWGNCSLDCLPTENNSLLLLRRENNGEQEGMLTTGVGGQVKMMKGPTHHRTTGFKPYKRCSVEANKESRVVSTGGNPDEEKNSKRMRLEGGASA